jgi:hypothetical protein
MLVLLLLLSACTGVAGTGTSGTNTLTGTVASVNPAQHSAVMNVNGQQVTVTGLTDQQVAALQTQVGKIYTLTVTGSGSTVTMSANATLEPAVTATTGTQTTPTIAQPTPTQAPITLAPGKIQFMGTVRTVNPSSIVVSMPDGSTLSMSISALTDRSDFGGGLPVAGQLIQVETIAGQDGSFTATKLKPTDANDVLKQNRVEYKGVTTSGVGADRAIHFKVGAKSYAFTVGPTADISDFGGNIQAIQANQLVKVKVQFAGSTATVLKVELSNG